VSAGELGAIPLFAPLGEDDLERVAAWARELRLESGEAAVLRWDCARDFYVMLEGTAVVERDGVHLAELGPGDFFGELAALDWGAGYGYARLATVTATSALRLGVFSPAHLAALMRSAPPVAEQIEEAVRARL
jgi:aromatic-L-amino-acid/L-tryptophan decarboxylase